MIVVHCRLYMHGFHAKIIGTRFVNSNIVSKSVVANKTKATICYDLECYSDSDNLLTVSWITAECLQDDF